MIESSHLSLGGAEVCHRFSASPGSRSAALELRNDRQTAARAHAALSALAFRAHALEQDDAFELRIEEVDARLAGDGRKKGEGGGQNEGNMHQFMAFS